MKNILKKVLVVLIGILLVFVLLEIILRIQGLINVGKSDTKNKKAKGNEIVILSVGDSFTRGIGAPEGQDYPAQLEKMLSTDPNRKYRVVNSGVAGRNTTQILNSLEADIEASQPDIAVLLLGGANNWNYWGYKSSVNMEGFGATIDDLLSHVRVYKLIKLIIQNVKDKMSSSQYGEGRTHLEQAKFDEELNKFKEAIRLNPNDGGAYYQMGAFYMYERSMDEAIKWFKDGIKANPDYVDNYIGIGSAYHELAKEDTTISYYLQGLKNSTSKDRDKLYGLVIGYYMKVSKFEDAYKYLKDGIQQFPYVKDFYNMLNNVREQVPDKSSEISDILMRKPIETSLTNLKYMDLTFSNPPNTNDQLKQFKTLVMSWIRTDILKAIKICHSKGIKVIMMNYPLRGHTWNFYNISYKQANGILQMIAKENNLLFIDNRQIFDELGKSKEEYLEPIGSADHCNTKGYGLIAQNVFNAIRQSNFQFPKNIEGKNDNVSRIDSAKLDQSLRKALEAVKERNFQGAISIFNDLIRQEPNNTNFYNDRAHAYMDMQKFNEALSDYNRAIQLDSNNLDAYNNRGYLKSMTGDYKGSIADYNRILEYSPHYNLALNNRGYAKYRINDFDGALADINSALKENEYNSYAYRNRALVYVAMNKIPLACKDIQKALDLGFREDYGNEMDDLKNKYCK